MKYNEVSFILSAAILTVVCAFLCRSFT